jgi:hypothetical protein
MRNPTPDEWRRHVAEWQASGLTCSEYAGRAGVKPNMLGWWKWKLGCEPEPRSEPRAEEMPFVEITPFTLAPPDGRFELTIGDISVQIPSGFDADALHRLLDVLEARR